MQTLDPLSTEVLENPYPAYEMLRREDPIHWHEKLNAWMVTRYADCSQILQDHETFVSDFRVTGEETPDEFLSLQTLDLPDHAAVRKAILPALRKVDLKGWLRETKAHAEKLLSVVDVSDFDFITEFAEPLAAHSMCVLFGIPLLEDETAFRSAQRDLVLSMDSGLEPSRREAGMQARRHLSGLVEPWIEHAPPAGLLSDVDYSAVSGEQLNFLVNSLRAIFVAGYSSTSSAFGNAIRALAEQGIFDAGTVPEIDQTAFHELVRFDGAVQAESRAVSRESQVGGKRLRAGEVVVVMVGSANRDGTIFSDPDKLAFDRSQNPHLGFGKGIHSFAWEPGLPCCWASKYSATSYAATAFNSGKYRSSVPPQLCVVSTDCNFPSLTGS